MSLFKSIGIKTSQRKPEKTFLEAVKYIKKELTEAGYNIYYEEYPDGYICTNDRELWYFGLVECPKWLFGIEIITGELNKMYFFAQHEDYIDKFKYEASTIRVEETFENIEDIYLGNVLDNIEFIKKYPYLAWCRDVNYKDLNTEYISLRKAKHVFKQSEKNRKKRAKAKSKLNALQKRYLTKFIEDSGYKYKFVEDTLVVEDPTIASNGWYRFMTDEERAKFYKVGEKIKKKYYIYGEFGDDCAYFVKKLEEI